MKTQMCISLSKRNQGIYERLEDFSNLLCLSKSDTLAHIIRTFDKNYQSSTGARL
jgi:hypothetical protein